MTTETAPQPPPGLSERPDVDALMERVRAGVAEKLARGVYTPEELERVSSLALAIREQGEFGSDTGEDVDRLHETWNPLGAYEFTSHRGGLGRLIVGAKRLARAALKPLASIILVRQAAFNGAVARLLTRSTHGVLTLEASHDALLLKHVGLERLHLELHARCNDLLLEIRRLQARLEAVDRATLAPEAIARPGLPLPDARPTPLSYLAFEEKHRGPGDLVKEKQRAYLPHFTGAPGRVLDAGCGRGEFLELLREAGIDAYGVDFDAEMAARAREKGLAVETGDLLGHLASLADGSLGGVFAAQVIEHMSTADLVSFVRLAHDKLAPGGRILAETVNPACLGTFAGTFYLDLTHVRPIHPEALRFLLEGVGFRGVELEFTSPFPPEMKLQEIDVARWLRDADQEFVRLVNDNFGRLNAVIYGCQDYAALARK